ncbi:hypothetical protein JW835_13395 [bacterium]|nr:hypothetical protein [bacterium]
MWSKKELKIMNYELRIGGKEAETRLKIREKDNRAQTPDVRAKQDLRVFENSHEISHTRGPSDTRGVIKIKSLDAGQLLTDSSQIYNAIVL